MCNIVATAPSGISVIVENFIPNLDAAKALRWWKMWGMEGVSYRIFKTTTYKPKK